MPHPLLATTYPGGSGAIVSAILWLLLTVASPVALLIGCLGFLKRFAHAEFPRAFLRLALAASVFAVVFLVSETSFVGWDAFLLLNDKAYFDEQFPVFYIRMAVNLATLLSAWFACRKMQTQSSSSIHRS